MRNNQKTKQKIQEKNFKFNGESLTRKNFCQICDAFLKKEEYEICNNCRCELYDNCENN